MARISTPSGPADAETFPALLNKYYDAPPGVVVGELDDVFRQAPAVAPPSQPDKPSTVEGPDPEPAEPGQPDTEPDGLKRDGKRTIFNVSRSKEREPAGV